ncbi:MAG: aspartyl protease family protein [Candidatus Eisenbacteria bacterium]
MAHPSGRRVAAATALLFIGSFAATPGSRAAITQPAASVVARYLTATGGSAAFHSERTLYTRAQVNGFGFTGRFESWSERPDRHHSRTTLGPFSLAEGSDGASAWRTDPTTSRVVQLTDNDLLDARVSTWFELERWAEADQGGGSVDLDRKERDSLGTYTVLRVSSPFQGVKPRRLWFDERTGLLARVVSPRDAQSVITELSDWRSVQGRSRAFVSVTHVAEMPMNRLTATTDSIAVNPSVEGLPFRAPDQSSGDAVKWLRHAGVAVLPVEYRARHLWLKVSLEGGPPEDFLFDTGASVTVLDSGFAARHGIATSGRMQAAGAGASGSATFAKLGSLAIRGVDGDGVEVSGLKVAVMNVAPAFSAYFWRDLAGVIGYDVISRFVSTIDYDAGTLTLHDPKGWRFPGVEAPLPMVMNGTVPGLRGRLDGRYEGVFRLDVGSSSTVDLHTPFVRQNQLRSRLRHSLAIAGTGFGGDFHSTLGRLKRMELGPYSWVDPIVLLSSATEGAFASEEFAGNIGNRLLERFRLTLDYERHQIFLEPGKRYPNRDMLTRTGLTLGWYRDHVTALSVLPGSAAARAGLREGERVIALDGKPILEWDVRAIDNRLEDGPDGRTLTLTVERDGAPRVLTVRLKEMLR